MKKDFNVLIVDDEREHADGLAEALQRCCARAVAIYDADKALKYLDREKVNVVVTDLKLGPDFSGLDILAQAKSIDRSIEVILITAYATIETCKKAIKQGAYDYLVKPIDIDRLRAKVTQAGRKSLAAAADDKAVQQVRVKRAQLGRHFEFDGIPGRSSAMHQVFEVLRRVSPTDITVLIEGQSGTGKELLARAIHNNSPRSSRPFIPVNCAGLTETLLESELFGHAKGAFTGAATDRKGLFEAADKGTLFLDEIGDMPLVMQAKLLRVLEDGLVVPVGSNKAVVVDVRVISATNHDLTRLIEEKKFRQDLYFRIKGVSVTVPALRQRPEDIPELAEFFLQEASAETGRQVKGITDAAKSLLMSYEWPGNVRQLRNCIRTMVVMCDRDMLDVQDIPPDIHPVRRLAGGPTTTAGGDGADLSGYTLDDLEKQAIADTLAKVNGNREKAAKILGIGERTLYRKIKEYNL